MPTAHADINRRITLAARPRGLPTSHDFLADTQAVPRPAEGQVLLRTLYLSIDPYMRNLMDEIGPGYAPSVAIGSPMPGGTVSRVVESRHPQFKVGQRVLANAGWQDYALSDGSDLQSLDDLAQPSHAMGGLGMPGFTAYVGLLDIGQPRPGETVVVAAATGAVGAVVGQLARLKGARVVGIAGGADKCRYAVRELGFDVCLVYFENVGGEVLDAVLPLLNIGARVPVCGFIAHYNENVRATRHESSPTAAPDRLPRLLATVLQKRIRMQGFIILDHYASRFEDFRRDMTGWLAEGRVKLVEDVVDGLDEAPAALIGLLQGRNFGKLFVRVAPDR
jgi:NADPH-dependent curcumin reductase CurA